jgi:hypothetical protein
MPAGSLRARWFAIAAPSGDPQIALVLLPTGKVETPSAPCGPLPSPADVVGVELGELCARGLERATAGRQGAARAVAVELSQPKIRVVEAGGRSALAVSELVASAARGANGGGACIRDEVLATGVRLSARVKQGAWQPEAAREAIACIGGSAGATVDGPETEAWLVVPRA